MLPASTPRLRFREMTPADLPDMATLDLGGSRGPEGWIRWQLDNYAEHGFGLWVVQTHAGEFVGDCGLTMQEVEGTWHVEAGWHVRTPLRRQGYAAEAAASVRDTARAAGVEHLIAIIRPHNLASQGVARRIGLVLEREVHKNGGAALVFGADLHPDLPTLERLRADHAPAVLAFERDNRAYFAASVSDRGEEFFDRFAARFQDLLAEQAAGICAFHVLVDDDGRVVGRFNLYDLADGAATVGYRVAERVAGRGVATAGLRALCRTAAGLGLRTLAAATSDANVASQKVLTKAGFVPVGPAHPSELGGKPGTSFRRNLITEKWL